MKQGGEGTSNVSLKSTRSVRAVDRVRAPDHLRAGDAALSAGAVGLGFLASMNQIGAPVKKALALAVVAMVFASCSTNEKTGAGSKVSRSSSDGLDRTVLPI